MHKASLGEPVPARVPQTQNSAIPRIICPDSTSGENSFQERVKQIVACLSSLSVCACVYLCVVSVYLSVSHSHTHIHTPRACPVFKPSPFPLSPLKYPSASGFHSDSKGCRLFCSLCCKAEDSDYLARSDCTSPARSRPTWGRSLPGPTSVQSCLLEQL